EVDQQDAGNEGDLQYRRDDVEDHEAQQETDAAGAPLDIPGQPAGTSGQMRAQVQPVQMFEDPEGDATHGPLGHTGEHRIAQFGEEYGGKAQQAVANQQDHGHQHQVLGTVLEVLDDQLEHPGHCDARQLGQHQTGHGQEHPATELAQIRQQTADDPPVHRASGILIIATGAHVLPREAILPSRQSSIPEVVNGQRRSQPSCSRPARLGSTTFSSSAGGAGAVSQPTSSSVVTTPNSSPT